MTDYDSPWKDILSLYFPDFLAFSHADVDWSRGYENLDSELQQTVRDAELGRRLVDKLFRVWRRDGAPLMVLTHVEMQRIQGSRLCRPPLILTLDRA